MVVSNERELTGAIVRPTDGGMSSDRWGVRLVKKSSSISSFEGGAVSLTMVTLLKCAQRGII